jgi:hypothetical protein
MMDSLLSPQEDKTLNRLVAELTLEERNSFLEKLQRQSTLSFELLHEDEEETGQGEVLEERYTRLPWYQRIRYLILSYIKSKPPVKLFEDSLVNKLGRKIEAKAPGVYDYHQYLLLLGFFDLLTELKDASRFFYTALDNSVNRDKGGFYAFLGSLEIGELHRRLETETTPELFTDRLDVSERELRQAALRAMEDIFSSMTNVQRNLMYRDARSLNCLKELAAFGFDRLIVAFSSTGGGQTCSVNGIRDLLVNLNNILFSLREPPALALLESLFIYRLRERAGEPGFDTDAEMRSLLERTEGAISTIRYFNRKVPLTDILRCGYRDMNLVPQQISGGENWFVIYHEYWKKQIEFNVTEYTRRHKHRELLNSFRYFLKDENLKALDNAASDANPQGFPSPEAFALSFLLTFHDAVFMNNINTFLQPILINGEFFKKENRFEFTGAYNNIIKIKGDIMQFDSRIAPSGEYGTRYNHAKDEISSLQLKRRKVQQILDEASHEASGIIIRARNAMVSLISILNSILKQEENSTYDTLVNMDILGGKTPAVFLHGIEESMLQLQQALSLFKDIDALESLKQ